MVTKKKTVKLLPLLEDVLIPLQEEPEKSKDKKNDSAKK
jgi:hypothetical protein